MSNLDALNVSKDLFDYIEDTINQEIKFPDFTDFENYSKPLMELYQLPYVRDTICNELSTAVGDDLLSETNCPELGVAMLFAADIIMKLKISWNDVGFSQRITNYAEEWHLLPPNIWSTFDGVNEYNRGGNFPLILDPIRVKDLSPVRKQSNMETDLKSKFEILSTRAKWADKNWPTYGQHQMSLILAMTLFDFENEIRFPFLTEMEGGCGGHPPWDNLLTVKSAIHYFNRGKSSIGIYGIMNESRMIHDNLIEPSQSIFCRYSHLAASGDLIWEDQISSLIHARELGFEDKAILDVINGIDERIEPFKIDLQIDQFVLPTLTILRKEMKIQSELDVRLRFLSLKRLEALKSELPFSKFLENEKEEKRLLKQRSLKYLSVIFGKSDFTKDKYIPSAKVDILNFYFKIKEEEYGYPAMFFYSGDARIFIKDEIDPLFLNLNKETLFKEVFDKTRDRKPREDKWIRPLISKINFDIPILASDDARILNQIRLLSYIDIVLITADRDLAMLAKGLALTNNCRFYNWKTRDYLEQSLIDRKNGFQPVSFRYFNPFKKGIIESGDSMTRYILSKFSWRRDTTKIIFLYDLPNIERIMAKYRFNYRTMLERKMPVPNRRAIKQAENMLWDLDSKELYLNILV